MKVSYISDIHLDFWSKFHMSQEKWEKRTKEFINKLIETDESEREVLVIAGDLSHFNCQSMWALGEFSNAYEQVVFTYGNHDMYFVSKNQASTYKNNSWNRIKELREESIKLKNVHPLFEGETLTHKEVKFGGAPMWYPLKTLDQQMFFNNISNDSNLIKGVDVSKLNIVDKMQYSLLLKENLDVMISHFPVINIDSHFKYNSTACYLTPVSDINVEHWVFGHSHEQKVYEKPYCNFYMNALGYPDEKLELKIRHFEVIK
jgi:DNA repair exonuclease SbcCD nuclease subunit